MRDLKFKKEFSAKPNTYGGLVDRWRDEEEFSVEIINSEIVVIRFEDHVSISKNDFKKIEELLKGKTDESHRLPYKKI